MNVYSNPEKFGLEVIGEVEDPRASYDFDTTVVWKSMESGKVYWANDSGCSCPIPFDYTGIDELNELNDLTWRDFKEALMERESYGMYDEDDKLLPFYDPAEANLLLAKATEAMKKVIDIKEVGERMTIDYEAAAKAGHEAYERIAPTLGYATREETRVAWEDLSGGMRELMVAAYTEGVNAALGDEVLYRIAEDDTEYAEYHVISERQGNPLPEGVTKWWGNGYDSPDGYHVQVYPEVEE